MTRDGKARRPVPGAWHLCCGPCRRGGHRDGCPRCEDRDRLTFALPHADDFRPDEYRSAP